MCFRGPCVLGVSGICPVITVPSGKTFPCGVVESRRVFVSDGFRSWKDSDSFIEGASVWRECRAGRDAGEQSKRDRGGKKSIQLSHLIIYQTNLNSDGDGDRSAR